MSDVDDGANRYALNRLEQLHLNYPRTLENYVREHYEGIPVAGQIVPACQDCEIELRRLGA